MINPVPVLVLGNNMSGFGFGCGLKTLALLSVEMQLKWSMGSAVDSLMSRRAT